MVCGLVEVYGGGGSYWREGDGVGHRYKEGEKARRALYYHIALHYHIALLMGTVPIAPCVYYHIALLMGTVPIALYVYVTT